MATWVTHLMVADGVLARYPWLDKLGFAAGNIAPDCNQENEDWTAFEPPRSVTHWMTGERKQMSDCAGFRIAYLERRKPEISSLEEYSFLLGYYSHLLTDAAFQRFIREPDRVAAVWRRILADPELAERAENMDRTWDCAKKVIPGNDRTQGIYNMEAIYLNEHPDSLYLTCVLPLKSFPDYIDYLPEGGIVRKIGVMGYVPQYQENQKYLSISPEEYSAFTEHAIDFVCRTFLEDGLTKWK